MQRWEYATVSSRWEGELPSGRMMLACEIAGGETVVVEQQEQGALLAQLGRDGWELVTVLIAHEDTMLPVLYFKRPLDSR